MLLLWASGVPALVAAVAAHATRRWLRVVVAGFGLGVAGLVFVYLSAQPADERPDCSECGVHLGRWLDPAAILVVLVLGLGGWIAGASLGAAARLAGQRR